MFCYQCEETAKGTGCTVKGVCGKEDATAGLQDVLIYLCKGVSARNVAAMAAGKAPPTTPPCLGSGPSESSA